MKAKIYYLIALIALILCWKENLHYIGNGSQFIPDLFATHASASFTYDIMMLGLAVFIWMYYDSKKLGIKHLWIYYVLSIAIAISVMVPIYLGQREKKLKDL